MLRIVFLFAIWSVFKITAFGQEVVISEYHNGSVPADEWAELLVINDNTTLSGYKLRDNSNSGQWMGGVVFARVPLWENLRAGTVIVIHFRGASAPDTNKSDGYIEIGAENTDYFIKFMSTGTINEWNEKALNILISNDILQLLSPDDTHVHSLSHSPVTTAAYNEIRGPKANYAGECPVGSSVKVVPGLNIEAYRSGSGTEHTEASSAQITKGLPNRSSVQSKDHLNQLYWRLLRQPKWRQSKPSMSVAVIADSIVLEWDIAQDAYPQDKSQGYLIIRIELPVEDNRDIASIKPEDGKIYNIGDRIGIGEVIVNIQNSLTNKYIDKINAKCGFKYTYKVFAFRFAKDFLGSDTDPRNARGRAYEESSYPHITVEKRFPNSPLLENDNFAFCKNDIEAIKVLNSLAELKYYWYLNSTPPKLIGEGNEIIISESGNYFVESENALKCRNRTDFFVRIFPVPRAFIIHSVNDTLRSDTTIFKCKGESVRLYATYYPQIIWLKDGKPASSEYQTESPVFTDQGEYRLVHSAGELCSDTSKYLRIVNIEPVLKIMPDTLIANVPSQESFATADAILELISPKGFRVNFTLPNEIELLLPEAPYMLNPGSNSLKIRVTPNEEGRFERMVVFEGICGLRDTLIVIINKEIRPKWLASSKQTLSLGLVPKCRFDRLDSAITLSNISENALLLFEPIINYPFKALYFDFPFELQAGAQFELRIGLNYADDGIYAGILRIPYFNSDENKHDTLTISLSAEIGTPSFEFNSEDVLLPVISDCETENIAKVPIHNSGLFDIILSKKPSNTRFEILNLPLLIHPRESDTLLIYYKALRTGRETLDFAISEELCSIEKGFKAIIEKTGAMFIMEDDTLNFGTIWNCGNNEQVTKNLILTAMNEGLPAEDFKIKDIRIEGNFSTSLFPGGSIFIGDNLLPITFEPLSEDELEGKVSFTLLPCEVEKVVVLKGIRKDLKYSCPEAVHFDNMFPGEIDSKSIVLKNNSTVPLIIEEISDIEQPFRIPEPLPVFPAMVLPGNEMILNIEYLPNEIGTDIAYLRMYSENPCRKEIVVQIFGECYPLPKVNARAKLPNSKTAESGEKFALPLAIEGNLDSLRLAEISSVEVVLTYNFSVLYPDSVRYGGGIEAIAINPVFSEMEPGYVRVKFQIPDPSELNDGVWLLFDFMALTGNNSWTDITIDTIIFISRFPISYEKNTCNFSLSGICIPGQRNVIIDSKPLSLSIECPQPISDNCKITFRTVVDGDVTIELFNSYGSLSSSLVSGRFPHGEHTAELPVFNLHNGVYFVVMKSGSFVKMQSIVIMK